MAFGLRLDYAFAKSDALALTGLNRMARCPSSRTIVEREPSRYHLHAKVENDHAKYLYREKVIRLIDRASVDEV
jgi:hypothetical protein